MLTMSTQLNLNITECLNCLFFLTRNSTLKLIETAYFHKKISYEHNVEKFCPFFVWGNSEARLKVQKIDNTLLPF